VALATLGLVADLLRAGKLVAPLPQRFSNPRSYYLLLPEQAADRIRRWRPSASGWRQAGAAVDVP
jgi:hypothetical protein